MPGESPSRRGLPIQEVRAIQNRMIQAKRPGFASSSRTGATGPAVKAVSQPQESAPADSPLKPTRVFPLARPHGLSSGNPGLPHKEAKPRRAIIGAAQGVAFANGSLVVADSNRQGRIPETITACWFLRISHPRSPNCTMKVPQNGTPCPDLHGATLRVTRHPAAFAGMEPPPWLASPIS